VERPDPQGDGEAVGLVFLAETELVDGWAGPAGGRTPPGVTTGEAPPAGLPVVLGVDVGLPLGVAVAVTVADGSGLGVGVILALVGVGVGVGLRLRRDDPVPQLADADGEGLKTGPPVGDWDGPDSLLTLPESGEPPCPWLPPPPSGSITAPVPMIVPCSWVSAKPPATATTTAVATAAGRSHP
jgi:hypothetical protein